MALSSLKALRQVVGAWKLKRGPPLPPGLPAQPWGPRATKNGGMPQRPSGVSTSTLSVGEFKHAPASWMLSLPSVLLLLSIASPAACATIFAAWSLLTHCCCCCWDASPGCCCAPLLLSCCSSSCRHFAFTGSSSAGGIPNPNPNPSSRVRYAPWVYACSAPICGSVVLINPTHASRSLTESPPRDAAGASDTKRCQKASRC